jgi:hypothetical protein
VGTPPTSVGAELARDGGIRITTNPNIQKQLSSQSAAR